MSLQHKTVKLLISYSTTTISPYSPIVREQQNHSKPMKILIDWDEWESHCPQCALMICLQEKGKCLIPSQADGSSSDMTQASFPEDGSMQGHT